MFFTEIKQIQTVKSEAEEEEEEGKEEENVVPISTTVWGTETALSGEPR